MRIMKESGCKVNAGDRENRDGQMGIRYFKLSL